MGDSFGHFVVVNDVAKSNGVWARYYVQVQCECGTIKNVRQDHLRSGRTVSCGCKKLERISKTGENAVNWRGGKYIDDDGYVCVYCPEHPNAKSNGYVREHRYVMSIFLERKLLKEENVHHINGDRTDNRLENLELWSKSQPPGQRIADKIKWAKELLQFYGEDETKYENDSN